MSKHHKTLEKENKYKKYRVYRFFFMNKKVLKLKLSENQLEEFSNKYEGGLDNFIELFFIILSSILLLFLCYTLIIITYETYFLAKFNRVIDFLNIDNIGKFWTIMTLIFGFIFSIKKLINMKFNFLKKINNYLLFALYLFFISLGYILMFSAEQIPNNSVFTKEINYYSEKWEKDKQFLIISCKSESYYSLVKEDSIECGNNYNSLNSNLIRLNNDLNGTYNISEIFIEQIPIKNSKLLINEKIITNISFENFENNEIILDLLNYNYVLLNISFYFNEIIYDNITNSSKTISTNFTISNSEKLFLSNFEIGFSEKNKSVETVYSLISITTLLSLFLVFAAVNNLRQIIENK
jgi:hypothetical protein